MCTGIELALLAASAVSAGAAVVQGQQAKETADTNAELQRRQGDADQDAAVAQAEKIRKAARATAAQANASLAASGVSIGDGTPVRINEQIYQNAESDAYSTLLTGSRQARALNNQANLTQWQGQNAETAGYINAGASVLSSGAKVGKGWTSAVSAGPALGYGLSGPNNGFWGK